MLTKRHNNLENSLSLNFNLLTRVCAELALVPVYHIIARICDIRLVREQLKWCVSDLSSSPYCHCRQGKTERIFCKANLFWVKYCKNIKLPFSGFIRNICDKFVCSFVWSLNSYHNRSLIKI